MPRQGSKNEKPSAKGGDVKQALPSISLPPAKGGGEASSHQTKALLCKGCRGAPKKPPLVQRGVPM